MLESLSNKVAGLKAGNFIKMRIQHRCFPVNWCFCQYDEIAVQYWASADPLFLIKKQNVGWFLLRRFVGLVRVSSLHITNRNHFNTSLLINLQKTKTCSQ